MYFKTTDAEPGTRIRHPSNGYQWRNKHNVHHNVTALVTKHSMNNHLTQKERNTVRRLRNNASTKSLPADKWKAMVDYLQRVATHFSMMINPACEYLQIFSQKQPTKESLADSEKNCIPLTLNSYDHVTQLWHVLRITEKTQASRSTPTNRYFTKIIYVWNGKKGRLKAPIPNTVIYDVHEIGCRIHSKNRWAICSRQN